jgi:hypothetical protein
MGANKEYKYYCDWRENKKRSVGRFKVWDCSDNEIQIRLRDESFLERYEVIYQDNWTLRSLIDNPKESVFDVRITLCDLHAAKLIADKAAKERKQWLNSK